MPVRRQEGKRKRSDRKVSGLSKTRLLQDAVKPPDDFDLSHKQHHMKEHASPSKQLNSCAVWSQEQHLKQCVTMWCVEMSADSEEMVSRGGGVSGSGLEL